MKAFNVDDEMLGHEGLARIMKAHSTKPLSQMKQAILAFAASTLPATSGSIAGRMGSRVNAERLDRFSGDEALRFLTGRFPTFAGNWGHRYEYSYFQLRECLRLSGFEPVNLST